MVFKQYKSGPCKKVCVTGWMVLLPDNPGNRPDVFRLNDPEKGRAFIDLQLLLWNLFIDLWATVYSDSEFFFPDRQRLQVPHRIQVFSHYLAQKPRRSLSERPTSGMLSKHACMCQMKFEIISNKPNVVSICLNRFHWTLCPLNDPRRMPRAKTTINMMCEQRRWQWFCHSANSATCATEEVAAFGT